MDADCNYNEPRRLIRNLKPVRCNEIHTRRARQTRGSKTFLKAIFATGKTYGPMKGV